MAKVINCDCGYVARGESDDELVTAVEEHVRDAHPGMEMSREDILGMAEEE